MSALHSQSPTELRTEFRLVPGLGFVDPLAGLPERLAGKVSNVHGHYS